ncbi:carbohydrate sulfotransferase 5-like [Mixophyes fleayi]|uniref:carbohydrate sulfotransferase 5-like n=1 Tax=Mixophyes fleayi TaxID=3061075 RepID=UPI003F4E10CF
MSRVRVYTVVILIIVHVILIFTQLGTKDTQTSKKHKTGKVHLLILSTWRSGSSLVGQFFSQHPDVFYLKEPTWHVWRSMYWYKAHVLQMAVRDMMRSIFRCDMSVFDAYMQNKNSVSDLFRWSFSRALCSPPACDSFSRNDIVTEAICRTDCGKYPFEKIEDTCNTYSHVVIQDVRIFDIKVLYSLLKDPTLNLKILHIVRDPRAVAKSWEQIKHTLKFDKNFILNATDAKASDSEFKVLKEICRSQVDIYETANSEKLFPLEGRYMLIRYDDLVRHPLKKVKEMFSFANLRLTENLSTWIYNITHGKWQAKVSGFQITPRDALYAAQAWRSVLTFETVNKVQNICQDAMDTFRYQFMDSEEELRDLTMKSVLPRRRDDFKWLAQTKNE